MSDDAPPPPPARRHGLLASFRFAFQGLDHLFRTQRNAVIHLNVACAVCILGFAFGVTRIEWAILVLTIACVIILEGLNTALEAAVDLASPQVHPLAKTAKDVAAGMVLVAAVAAVVVGLLIFAPRVWAAIVH